MNDPERRLLDAYYGRGEEQDRLSAGARGALEFERTVDIVLRHLPAPPTLVADVGGGPGRYSLWLAGLGYRVEHRDIMPLHVRQLATSVGQGAAITTRVGDARNLDLADESVDAVLLLGPLYHLPRRADRLAALREARRVVRRGGPVFAAAISRWAPRLDGELSSRLYEPYPDLRELLPALERTGWMGPLHDGAFTAYCHRPGQLRRELAAAGLRVADLVCVEGAAFLLGDLDERQADPRHWQVVLDGARATERVPELLGLGPHLLATGIRPAGPQHPEQARDCPELTRLSVSSSCLTGC
ncbi:MAG: class I SAM-dependent methyltransferase [Streptosporangiaceae bacterium]